MASAQETGRQRGGSATVVKAGSEPDVLRLLEELKSGSVFQRQRAAELLGKKGDPRAVDMLVPLLQYNDSYVRELAIEALGRLGDGRAVEPLIAVIEQGATNLSAAATTALARLERPAISNLVQMLGSPLVGSRTYAQEALRSAGADSVGPLVGALGNPAGMIRTNAADILLGLDKLGVERLIAELLNTNAPARSMACDLLGKLGDRRAVNPLISVLWESSLRAHSRDALDKLGEPFGGKWLYMIQGDGGALDQIVTSKEPQIPSLLLKALKDDEPTARVAVATAIGRVRVPGAVTGLIPLLSDSSPRVRAAAAQALGGLGDARAVEPLLQGLKDEDVAVFDSANTSLKTLPWPKNGLELVARIAGDKSLRGRYSATRRMLSEAKPWSGDYWTASLIVLTSKWSMILTGLVFLAVMVPGKVFFLLAQKAYFNRAALLAWRAIKIEAACLGTLFGIVVHWGPGGVVPALVIAVGAAAVWAKLSHWVRGQWPEVEQGVGGFLGLGWVLSLLVLYGPAARLDQGSVVFFAIGILPLLLMILVGLVCGLIRWGKALKRMEGFVCTADYHRFIPGGRLPWLVRWSGRWLAREMSAPGSMADSCQCRACHNGTRFDGVRELVAVLDSRSSRVVSHEGDTLRVNWMVRKQAFDFDAVEVVEASDEDVNEFLRQTRWQIDARRRSRLRTMRCDVNVLCKFQQESSTLTNLRQTFGFVESK